MKARSTAPRLKNRDLDVADILAFCEQSVPVNCRVETAIAAHRIAFSAYQHDPDACQLAMFTLRTVVLAMTPCRDDAQKMFDYLSGLPFEAWCATEGYSIEQVREATLAGISRSIEWLRHD